MPADRKLRVLHVAPYFDRAWAWGGIPRVAAAQVRGLLGRGHAVTVATTDIGIDAEMPGNTDIDGADVRVFPNASRALAAKRQFFLPRGLRSFLSRSAESFDVAHLHACHNLLTSTAAAAMRQHGVPYILQPNGTARRIEHRRALKWVFDALFSRRVFKDAARIIAVSVCETAQFDTLGIPAERRVRLPNPIDLEEFDLPRSAIDLRGRFGLGAGPLLLYLGQISPRKRVDLCVEALAGLGDLGASLVIAGADMGAGPDVRRLIAARGLEDRVHFAGVLVGADRLAALTEADVVLYPTENEIFGLVPIEALLCGTPIIVGDDCGCGEIIEEIGGGRLVPRGDAQAVGAAVMAITGDLDAWRRPVAAAASAVRRRFAGERICADLESLYREVVA